MPGREAACAVAPRRAERARGPRATPAPRPETPAPSDDAGRRRRQPRRPTRRSSRSPDDLDRRRRSAPYATWPGRIGPREATGPAYDRAAGWVAGELARLGYDVERQRVDVPAGESWGVRVAGRTLGQRGRHAARASTRPSRTWSSARTSTPCRRRPARRTTPRESGCCSRWPRRPSVRRTRLPMVFVAFGAEEPRGPTDDDHHYGSRHYVDRLGARGSGAAVRGMVSLDRVGVGDRVPVGSAGDTDPVQRALLAAARRAGVADRRRGPGSAAATTGRSSGPGCRARASARRRTPATTRRATCRPSCRRPSSSGSAGSSPRGWPRAEERSRPARRTRAALRRRSRKAAAAAPESGAASPSAPIVAGHQRDAVDPRPARRLAAAAGP